MLGVTDNRAKLWVDCKPVKSIDGQMEGPLRQRGQYDINNGYLSIAQIVDNQRNYEVWCSMSCEASCCWLIYFSLFSIFIDGTACKDEIWYYFHLSLNFSHLLDWPPMACHDLWPQSCITSVMWWDSRKLWTMKNFHQFYQIYFHDRDMIVLEQNQNMLRDHPQIPVKFVHKAHRDLMEHRLRR